MPVTLTGAESATVNRWRELTGPVYRGSRALYELIARRPLKSVFESEGCAVGAFIDFDLSLEFVRDGDGSITVGKASVPFELGCQAAQLGCHFQTVHRSVLLTELHV